jgi:hypothetical protein
MLKIIKKTKARRIKSLRGIAMIEAMLAITIIMIAIMAPLTISTYSSKYAKLAINRITATYLAEEQLEMVINLRKSLDIYCFNNLNNCANGDSFDEFDLILSSAACGTVALPCYIDEGAFIYNSLDKPVYSPGADINNCRYLYIKSDDIVSCNAAIGVSSPYTRKLIVERVDNLININNSATQPNAIKLTSLICINSPGCNIGDTNSVTLNYNIYK